ncbi:MAG: PH domain-containing protein [Thermoplasmata archaeon]
MSVTTGPLDVELESGAAKHYGSWASYSYAVIGTYIVLLLLAFLTVPGSFISDGWWVPYVLYALILFFLIRYLSTHYSMDADRLHASRILGSRHMSLHEVRKIEFVSLSDLSPGGFFGSWGWRGRMWTPSLGHIDAIYTGTKGILITADSVPLFISPRDPPAFARELSRRVRSYRAPLAVDDGAPPR